ncbi:hypothetical protein MIB92_06630 [Aestuariirhabdus sp. Z084]|uniref:Vgb family protein n=1 Tax=Aestuariirhabdus haliotis TaxID=2918751 RepID=UPI00201B3BE2|nr:hypothetical protein [Aestuariirhabdus haliotis]MCL6415319.1 hypothetical protein [Aestuariirhabdus haliotis]MCL6419075.1 hypothetical protein [Aestuariirhabdus haliotis]
MNRWLLVLLAVLSTATQAVEFQVLDAQGDPLPTVMVSAYPTEITAIDKSDNGYPPHAVSNKGTFEYTRFTDTKGVLSWPDLPYVSSVRYRLRKQGYQDLVINPTAEQQFTLTMRPETDSAKLAASRSANTWLAALDLGGDEELKKHFVLQCGFCHQQGTKYIRWQRTADEWSDTFDRMIGYGSRLHDDAQDRLPQLLEEGYRELRENPKLIPPEKPWQAEVVAAKIKELPIGDSFSQMHDLLLASSGLIYVGDNLQDRLYEIDPETGEYSVYRLPRLDYELGGILAGKLKQFPKHESYMGIHSFAESKKDGHIFITPSVQQAILEFDPISKTFTVHEMEEGYYPHTIRVDQQDRVWFTLAISNQVAMFDRATGEFTYYDLPTRSFKESLTVSGSSIILQLARWGVPLHTLPIDKESMGLPLPYGIDVAPDGTVWFARLHTDAIGKIDPVSGEVIMIPTPFKGPRRLRADSRGHLWIAAFPEGQIVEFDPETSVFTRYDMPTEPLGSDTPYSLNVDRERDLVWVNGNASDSLLRFDINRKSWRVFPMPRRVTFTRDVEIAPDGSVFTTNSSFPSWHIEDGQPTLIHLQPGE